MSLVTFFMLLAAGASWGTFRFLRSSIRRRRYVQATAEERARIEQEFAERPELVAETVPLPAKFTNLTFASILVFLLLASVHHLLAIGFVAVIFAAALHWDHRYPPTNSWLPQRSGIESLIGQTGVVLDFSIDSQGQLSGRVRVAGETWSASGVEMASIPSVGSEVEILSVRGISLVVRPALVAA